MTRKRFLRSTWGNCSRLGRRRKNKQKYRKAKGEDNKMRLKIKGHPRNVSIGFSSSRKTRHKIQNSEPVLVHNVEGLKKIKKGQIGVLAKVGDKRKTEIAKYLKENKIKIRNMDPEKFLEKIDKKIQEAKKKKEAKSKKKLEKNKKSKKQIEKKEKQEAKEKDEKAKNKTEEKNKEQKETKKDIIEDKSSKKEIQTNNYGRGK